MNQKEVLVEERLFTIKFEDIDAHPKEKNELRHYIYRHIEEHSDYGRPFHEEGSQYSNIANNIISNICKKSFSNESFDVRVTDYSEREGSFIIEFTLLAIIYGGFISYGSFRQSLDYFVKDIRLFFREVTERTPIELSIRNNVISQITHHQDNGTHSPQAAIPPQIQPETNNGFSITLKEILLFITLVNLVLFFGGTVWSGIKITSIEDKYREAVTIVNDAQKELSASENTLSKLKREAIRAEYEVKSLIETYVQNIGDENIREIEKLSGELVDDLKSTQNKVEILKQEGNKLSIVLDEIKELKEKSIQLINQSSIVVNDLEQAKQTLFSKKNIPFDGLISSIWNSGDLWIKLFLIVFFLIPTIFVIYQVKNIIIFIKKRI